MSKEYLAQEFTFIAFRDSRGAAKLIATLKPELTGVDEARFKVMAELSCLAYQLTKIPLIAAREKGQDGKESLRELMGKSALYCRADQLEELVNLRCQLFDESQARREKYADKERASQSIAWVWTKVRGEEMEELSEEAKNYCGGLGFGLQEGIEDLRRVSESGEFEPAEFLKKIFALAHFLGLKNELNLFQFMAEKQRGRIALRKGDLTKKDKEEEWQRLLPLARQYFG